MNHDDGTIISDTTNEDSVTYMHTIPIVRTMELPPVIVECKPNVPKFKGIRRSKHEIFVDNSLLYDIWCNNYPFKSIKLVDVIDTVAKPICTTQLQWNIAWRPSSIFLVVFSSIKGISTVDTLTIEELFM
jgi:hypothetical protein